MFFEGAVDKAGSREDKHTGLSQMDSPVLLSGREGGFPCRVEDAKTSHQAVAML